MAIEIRELVIKAIVVDDESSSQNFSKQDVDIIAEKEHIIQECVNQVLKIIKKSKNR